MNVYDTYTNIYNTYTILYNNYSKFAKPMLFCILLIILSNRIPRHVYPLLIIV